MGRPAKYETAEEMQKIIEKYFKKCKGKPLKIDGKQQFNKYGEPIILDARPPTITGLALALGFNSRQSLLNYQGKEEFMDTITRAKARVEQYAEEQLYTGAANGAKFNLANNFAGWKEKLSVEKPEKLEDLLE